MNRAARRRASGHRAAAALPCPWCPGSVVLTTVDDAWDLFACKPDAGMALDALAAWHCHRCGSAGLVLRP